MKSKTFTHSDALDLKLVESELENALSRCEASVERLRDDDAVWYSQVFDSAFMQLPVKLQQRICDDESFAEAVNEIDARLRASLNE